MDGVTTESVKRVLEKRLQCTLLDIEDTSGGCGQSFQVNHIVSPAFEGKKLLERHRLINDAMKEEMAHIHAFSIKRAWTPEEFAKAQGAHP